MDPQHLYQRLLVIGADEIPFLCLPASLFSNYLQMRTGDKSELIHNLLKLVNACIMPKLPTAGLQYVADGGGLLHKFSWPKHPTYSQICEMYVRHVKANYGNALIIFDGYHGQSTKDEVQHRRMEDDVGATVSVSSEMRLTMSKKAFQRNE